MSTMSELTKGEKLGTISNLLNKYGYYAEVYRELRRALKFCNGGFAVREDNGHLYDLAKDMIKRPDKYKKLISLINKYYEQDKRQKS